MRLFSLTEKQFTALADLCEAVVPGSRATGPAVYVDSLVADAPEPRRAAVVAAIEEVAAARAGGVPYEELASRPAFQMLRALAIEAYYGDFRRPGYDGPSGWDATGFGAAPIVAMSKQDWSFLACHREAG
ncbi:hypothetical protein [Actinomadura miaoliensis]|uniref:Gluconate 2-dehydrogenase subunit 3 family protein n=1 Tax=Actinomadura miaoliensis TaxID=430685 RepID=A0ABP7WJX2_9ACTN